MKKYKVYFSGFAYVEADSHDEAIEQWRNGEAVYEEFEDEGSDEVDEFVVGV
jgi:hypothetical protein